MIILKGIATYLLFIFKFEKYAVIIAKIKPIKVLKKTNLILFHKKLMESKNKFFSYSSLYEAGLKKSFKFWDNKFRPLEVILKLIIKIDPMTKEIIKRKKIILQNGLIGPFFKIVLFFNLIHSLKKPFFIPICYENIFL